MSLQAHADEAGSAAGRTPLTGRAIALDLLERAIVMVVFASFLRTMLVQNQVLDARVVLLVISETLPIALVFMRGPTNTISRDPVDWLFGVTGTCLGLLAASPKGIEPFLPQVGVVLMTLGLAVQCSAKLFLGRSFGLVAANRGVKSQGPYRFVRHPMYAGYTIGHLGFLIAFPNVYNAALYAGVLGFQILRMQREERILGQDEAYRGFAAEVRYRLVPGIY